MESRKGLYVSHLLRVTQLQNELQELSERERRARHHNQKLLQDFQRAQNTLSDLVARTEAMNTIRMEYERFLEENFPKWQQKLQEKRLSEQQMMIEQHLKACTLRTDEEGQRKGYKQNMQGNFPSTWLTQSPILVTEPEHGISKHSKNTQNVHQVWNSSLLDYSLLSGSPVFLQDHNSSEHLRQYPNSCTSGCGKFNVRVKCPNDCPSWSHLSLTNDGKSRREEKLILKQQDASANSHCENHHMQKQRKKVNSRDTKPVNISTYRDTSENSDLYTKAVKRLPTEVPTTRDKRSEEKQTHNTRKGAVSEGSCSVSDSQSVSNHRKQKRNQQSNGRKSAFKTSKVTNYPKQLVKVNKHESNLIEERHTSNCCTVKTGRMKRYEDDTEEEEEIFIPEEKRVNEMTNRDSTENHGNRASLYEELDKKKEVVERYREQDSLDEEEEETLRSNTSVKESLLEEVNSVRGSETEDGGAGEEQEEDGVRGDEDEKSRSSGQMNKEDHNESEQEGNYGEVLKSGSERSIQDR
ncbi:glutamic acid-rich protein-like [Tachysurus vachellii]|uniref:glutamic acid-rich protein-like n=1 Tax=Tachysurus vachellii TaxID=175792 RepID=UPI00296B3265|nr:glutamic acid-rich protein-like [Tachysurus vachellii]